MCGITYCSELSDRSHPNIGSGRSDEMFSVTVWVLTFPATTVPCARLNPLIWQKRHGTYGD